jgi:hypothetical protein
MIYLRHGYGYGIAIVVDVGRWDIVSRARPCELATCAWYCCEFIFLPLLF